MCVVELKIGDWHAWDGACMLSSMMSVQRPAIFNVIRLHDTRKSES